MTSHMTSSDVDLSGSSVDLSDVDLSAVQRTKDAVSDIEAKLRPLLAIHAAHKSALAAIAVHDPSSSSPAPEIDRNEVAAVRAAIALGIGSLSFIRLRLQGVRVTKEHPVQQTLKQIQATMKKLSQAGVLNLSKPVAGGKRKAEEEGATKRAEEQAEEQLKEQLKEQEEAKAKETEVKKVVGGTLLSQPKKKVKKNKKKR
jgi:hypothetical protein